MERKQFDRLIDHFKNCKTHVCEMTADIEPCFAMVACGHNFDEQSNEALMMACHAKAIFQKLVKICQKATEVHGGMGFTDLLGPFLVQKNWNESIAYAQKVLRRETPSGIIIKQVC